MNLPEQFVEDAQDDDDTCSTQVEDAVGLEYLGIHADGLPVLYLVQRIADQELIDAAPMKRNASKPRSRRSW